jgi:iron complex outermembrane receptor protein
MPIPSHWRRRALGLAFAAVLARAPALAAEEPSAGLTPQPTPLPTDLVEKVEVSSTVAKEREDAASFSDLDREAIEARHRGQDLGMLLGDTPNAYAYSDSGSGVGYLSLRLRGFDQTRIAVNLNGVPLNTPESRQVYYIDLADLAGSLDLVQVQRGPGTALYGSPAVGGVVNLETGNLEPSSGGRFVLGGGSFGTYRASVQYGGPLAGGRWAWSARVAHVRSEGYRDASWTRHSIGSFAVQKFGDASVWRIFLLGGPERTQLAYAGVPAEYLRGEITGDADRDRRANFLRPGETDRFVQPQLQVHNDRRLAEGLFLRNTWYAILGRGAYSQYNDTYAYAPLGSDPPSAEFPNATLAGVWRRRAVYNRQLGWIPRVSWDHRGGALTAGAEILFHEGRHRGRITAGERCVGADPADACAERETLAGDPVLYRYDNRKDTINVFVRETVRLSPQLAINAELQGTHHRYAMDGDTVRGYGFAATYTFLTPRLGLNWNVSERWNLYAQGATSRSEPIFSNVWNPQETALDPRASFRAFDPVTRRLSDPRARPEKLRSIELGVGFREGATRFKANAYRMGFRDEFVFAGGLDDDGVPRTENAGRSLHQGLEIEAAGRLPGGIDLSGYAALSRDVLREYRVNAIGDGAAARSVDYSGNRVALFPDSMFRLRVGRAFGAARLEAGVRRIGTIYTDNSQDERRDPVARAQAGRVAKKVAAHAVVDLRATFDLARVARTKAGGLSLQVWIDNLLDRRYETMGYSYPDPAYTGFYTEFFPGAPRNAFFALSYGF